MKKFVLLIFISFAGMQCVQTEQIVDGKVYSKSTGEKIIIGNLSTDDPEIIPATFSSWPSTDEMNYPEMSKRAGIEGVVSLFVEIDENGNLTDVKVTRGIGGGCDETAWNTLRNQHYIPAKNAEGENIAAKHQVKITFEL